MELETHIQNDPNKWFFETIINQSEFGVIVADENNAIVYANKSFENTTGYTLAEVMGKNPKILKSGIHSADFYKDLWDSIHTNGQWQGVIWNKRKDGMIYAERMGLSVVKNGAGEITHYFSVFSDITTLADSEERHFSLYDKNPNAVLEMQEDGKIKRGNEASELIFDCRVEDLCDVSILHFIDPIQRDEVTNIIQRAANGESSNAFISITTMSSRKVLHVTIFPIYITSNIDGIYLLVKDVTNEVRFRDLIAGQNEILNRIAKGNLPLLDILRDIVVLIEQKLLPDTFCCILDDQQSILSEPYAPSISKEFREFVGTANRSTFIHPCDTAVKNRTPIDIPDIDRSDRFPSFCNCVRRFGFRSCSAYPIVSGNGLVFGAFYVFAKHEFLPNEIDQEILQTFANIIGLAIEKHINENKIQYLAYHDSLTGLFNRQYFNEVLESTLINAQSSNAKTAIFYLDLDRLKSINDSLGHSSGNKLIISVAERLTSGINHTNYICRLGGDEFVVIVPNIETTKTIDVFADQLLGLFSEPIPVDDHLIHVTASIGAAVFPDHGLDAATLLRNADRAMYNAKLERNSFCLYDQGMNIKTYRSFLIENDLHRALEKDELFLLYQPRIKLGTKQMKSVEALIRWQHPELGFISPAEFIPIAEETDLSIDVDIWVLRHVCMMIQDWLTKGLPEIKVAVNISARHFSKNNMISSIKAILDETHVDPKLLEIELTERILMSNNEVTKDNMLQLERLGIAISIDDFGTGYSSLSYIKRFHIDALKIDGSFIKDMSRNSDNMEIVKTIINMTKNLNMKSVAECVEKEEDLHILQLLDCDEVQGFFYSPPIRSDELEHFIVK